MANDYYRDRFRPNDYADFNRGDYVRADDREGYEARPSYRGRGPKNYQRSDDRIHEDVCERLSMDDRVDASEVEVLVQGGIVTLNGTVRDRLQKRRAEDVAESVGGVRDIENRIRVAREVNSTKERT